jgi:hypothetical protein
MVRVPARAGPVPALERFPASEARPPQAARISFCQDAFREAQDPDLRRLDGCWIVAGAQGIQAFSRAGVAVPVPAQLALDPGEHGVAVAVVPPGEGPVPGPAPRLAYAVSRPGAACADRVFALDLDGSRRELPLGGAGEADPPRRVRDLALDRDGHVFVALGDRRDILRIDLAGNAILHARLPEAAAQGDPEARSEGILAMARDPRTGSLYVAEPSCLWKVTVRGLAAPVPAAAPARPRHLAVHGRRLLMVDPDRREILTLHLKKRRLATLLGPDCGRTRFGPIHPYAPALPAAACAALGGAGPVAVTADGCCLVAVEQGFGTFTLPEARVSGASRPGPAPAAAVPAAARAAAGREAAPRPTAQMAQARKRGPTRRDKLERWRAVQLAVRMHKRRLRELGQEAARNRAELEVMARTRPRGHPREAGGPRKGGLACLALLALGAITDPGLVQALAPVLPPVLPPFPPSFPAPRTGASLAGFVNASAANVMAGIDQLDQACAFPPLAGQAVAPCAGGYSDQVRTEAARLQAEALHLLVDPPVLGRGECLAGEPEAQAKVRIRLAESDMEARFARLNADSLGFWFERVRDGYVILAAGAGLLAGQAAAAPIGANVTALAGVPSLVLGETGSSLITGAFALQGAAAGFGSIGYKAATAKAKWRLWANAQGDRPLICTGTALPAVPAPAPGPGAGTARAAGPASPWPALLDTMQKLAEGCGLAARHGLVLQACAPESLAEFRQRNATLAGLYSPDIACLAAGAPGETRAACPQLLRTDARTRSDLSATIEAFGGEVGEVAAAVFAAGNAFYAASEANVAASVAATAAADAVAAKTSLVLAYTFSSAGDGLFASAYDLYRLNIQTQGWIAEATRTFNAAAREELDQAEFWEQVTGAAGSRD